MSHQEHEFAVILAEAEGSEEEANALYASGCDDGTVSTCGGLTQVYFHRSAPSLEEAIRSALANIQAAGFRVAHVLIEPESLAHVG